MRENPGLPVELSRKASPAVFACLEFWKGFWREFWREFWRGGGRGGGNSCYFREVPSIKGPFHVFQGPFHVSDPTATTVARAAPHLRPALAALELAAADRIALRIAETLILAGDLAIGCG